MPQCVAVIWTEQPIFFIDFEGNQTSGVLELGVVEVHGGAIGATHTRLCRPTGPVRPEDAALHGLRTHVLADCAPFADEWETFARWRERGPLAAHYAGVENALLKATWPYPRSSPDFARPGESVVDWGPWIDTGRLYAQLYPELGTGQLEALVAACGLKHELDALAAQYCPPERRRYHAALYDALAGALLLASLARDPRLATLSIMQLLALSTLDADKRDALQQRELFE
ncbi:3'-5' exonuclease [Opitutus terrae]|uniref:Exonuclease RNase T and DNA polymerase III n=1 Tax=Opitutus terrae (strain DSM 11246 / JCM 15787 / PB90-1) TaxID=452637 RepID=B1ZQ89_OPITP|nr:3'-5' exonuclease [Opitutus terrae]ACB73569.1 Exonuclease RNase T and DNA polymerase III [Opitutus terrae PB90-1]